MKTDFKKFIPGAPAFEFWLSQSHVSDHVELHLVHDSVAQDDRAQAVVYFATEMLLTCQNKHGRARLLACICADEYMRLRLLVSENSPSILRGQNFEELVAGFEDLLE